MTDFTVSNRTSIITFSARPEERKLGLKYDLKNVMTVDI